MNSRRRNLIISLTITLISVAAMLILFELGLRIAGWQRFFETVEKVEEGAPRSLDIRTLRCGAEIRHATREFDVIYRTNSLGYYDREWVEEKSPGTTRIGFFGDSFTMGHGVGTGKAFARLAGPILSKKAGSTVEILNFGIWGSGTLDQREYIEDAVGLELDHVVICFFINDIFDNMRYMSEMKARSEGGAAADEEEKAGGSGGGAPRGIMDFLNRNVRVFAFTMERSKNLRDALGLVTYPLEKVFTGGENDAIEKAAGYLNEIDAYLGEKDVDLTVVYIPSRVQTCPVKVPDSFDIDLPNTILGRDLDGVEFIDLTGDLRRDDASDLWFREGHFNEKGHELVARLIAERLSTD